MNVCPSCKSNIPAGMKMLDVMSVQIAKMLDMHAAAGTGTTKTAWTYLTGAWTDGKRQRQRQR